MVHSHCHTNLLVDLLIDVTSFIYILVVKRLKSSLFIRYYEVSTAFTRTVSTWDTTRHIGLVNDSLTHLSTKVKFQKRTRHFSDYNRKYDQQDCHHFLLYLEMMYQSIDF